MSNAPLLRIGEEVRTALEERRPVVALESTIICHGMPWPDNLETARDVEDVVRKEAAVPATIAVVGGRLTVGLETDELEALARKGTRVAKVSRRDLPAVVTARGDGATTVAATMIIAAMAGIPVFATGGIGGVHRDVAETLDISADLTELGRTNVAVVCAGIKSILDIPRSLECLETLGVPVIGFGTDEMPAFYVRTSGQPVGQRVDDAATVARILETKWAMGLDGGVVVANPIPEAHGLPREAIDRAIDAALVEMKARNVRGKDATPFLLRRVAETTKGASLAANVALVLNNARLAANIAREYQSLIGQGLQE